MQAALALLPVFHVEHTVTLCVPLHLIVMHRCTYD